MAKFQVENLERWMHMTTYSEEKPLFDDHPTWDTSDKKWFEAIWQNTKSV